MLSKWRKRTRRQMELINLIWRCGYNLQVLRVRPVTNWLAASGRRSCSLHCCFLVSLGFSVPCLYLFGINEVQCRRRTAVNSDPPHVSHVICSR